MLRIAAILIAAGILAGCASPRNIEPFSAASWNFDLWGQLDEASVLDISTAVDIARSSEESRHFKIYGVAVISRREIHVYFTSPSDVVVAYLVVKRVHNKWQKGEQVIWTA